MVLEHEHVTTQPTSPPRTTTNVTTEKEKETSYGGDTESCLNADDIDKLRRRLLKDCENGSTIRSAWDFYHARTGDETTLRNLGTTIEEELRQVEEVILPTHVRHHWLVTVYEKDQSGGIAAKVYDSAPSGCVRRTLTKLLKTMLNGKLTTIRFCEYAKQRRNSDECGLFTILALILLRSKATMPTGEMSLHEWRKLIFSATTDDLLQAAIPPLRRVDEGAGPKKKDTEGGTRDDENIEHNDVDQMDADNLKKVPFALRDVNARGGLTESESNMLRQEVEKLHAERTREWQAEVAKITAEYKALSTAEKAKRKREFDRRRQPTVPQDVLDVTIWSDLVDQRMKGDVAKNIARKILNLAESTSLERENLANSETLANMRRETEDGEFMSTRLIEGALRVIQERTKTEFTDWLMVKPLEVAPTLRRMREGEISTQEFWSGARYCAIATLYMSKGGSIEKKSNHFFVVTCEREDGTIKIFDSLNPSLAQAAQQLRESGAGDLAEMITGKQGPASVQRVTPQATNNCALEMLRNLTRVIYGYEVGITRRQIRQMVNSVTDPSALNDHAQWRTLLGPKPTIRQNDPYARAKTASSSGTPITIMRRPTQGEKASNQPAAPQQEVKKPGEKEKDAKNELSRDDLGDRIHAIVSKTRQQNADKITGMLLEMDAKDVLALLHCPNDLQEAIQQCEEVLNSCKPRGNNSGPAQGRPTEPPKIKRHDPYVPVIQTQKTDEGNEKAKKSLRSYISEIPLHSILRVPWRMGEERGIWLGELRQKPRPGLPATIRYFATHCTICDEYHEWDETTDDEIKGEDYDIPFLSTIYGKIEIIDEIPEITRNCDADEEDDDDDTNEKEREERNEKIRRELREFIEADSLPLGSTQKDDPLRTRGVVLRDMYIYTDKPPHIHNIVWNKKSRTTRLSHIRWLRHLKTMPDDVASLEISKAIVEFVLRWSSKRRKLRWSTIAGYLSTISSAVENLSLYTNRYDIKVRTSQYLRDAIAYASAKARIENATDPNTTRGITHEQFTTLLRNERDPDVQALLALTWTFSARVADARRLRPENIEFINENEDGSRLMKILIVEGKSVTWNGPYYLCERVDATWYRRFYEIIRRRKEMRLFDEETQSKLSTAIASLRKNGERYSLRSIRKGALRHHAMNGTPLPELLLVSGHKNLRTLRRYLGWGNDDPAITDAAELRYDRLQETSAGGGAPTSSLRHPMWMGIHSGTCTKKGRRTLPPPDFCPQKAPTRAELGLADPTENCKKDSLPLHMGDPTTNIDLKKLLAITKSPELRKDLQQIMVWMTSPRHYGVTWPTLTPAQIPKMGFTIDQERQLLEGEKLRRYDGPIYSASKGFGHIESRDGKQRIRPVFETLINATIDREHLPALHYPSRRERRYMATKWTKFLELDFKGYYDQFAIPKDLEGYYVVRGNDGVYTLTRLPMGCSFAAHVAQVTTWCLLEPLLLRMRDETQRIQVTTSIDNIGISTDDDETTMWAISSLMKRCDEVGAKLKPTTDYVRIAHDSFHDMLGVDHPATTIAQMEDLAARQPTKEDEKLRLDVLTLYEKELRATLDNDDTLAYRESEVSDHLRTMTELVLHGNPTSLREQATWASLRAQTRHTFLGEELRRKKDVPQVRNATKHVEKLRDAYERLQRTLEDTTVSMTKRNLATMLGLINYLALTIDLRLCQHITLTRLFCELGRDTRDWDDELRPTPTQVSTIGLAIGRILHNDWVDITEPTLPPTDYDMMMIIDACATGWGGYARLGSGEVFEIRSGWKNGPVQHSTQSETRAICEFYEFATKKQWLKKNDSIAIVTDHEAVTIKQRRSWKATGGFSSAYFLNEVFRRADDLKINVQFYYVHGELNPADGPSRSTALGDETKAKRRTDITLPDLQQFVHPYATREPQLQWFQR